MKTEHVSLSGQYFSLFHVYVYWGTPRDAPRMRTGRPSIATTDRDLVERNKLFRWRTVTTSLYLAISSRHKHLSPRDGDVIKWCSGGKSKRIVICK